MKVLVLNCGSSSIKYKLYNMDDESVLAQGGVERIGLDNAFIKVTLPNGEKKQIMHDMTDHKEGVNFVFKCLLDPEIGAIKDLKEIDAVGHRVVQGGDKFKESVVVDKSVEDGIEELCDLAPVHNAGHLKGIRAVDALMPVLLRYVSLTMHSIVPCLTTLIFMPFLMSCTRSITFVAMVSMVHHTAMCPSVYARFLVSIRTILRSSLVTLVMVVLSLLY